MSIPFISNQNRVPWARRQYKKDGQSIKHLSQELGDLSSFLKASVTEEQCRMEMFGRYRSLILACFPGAKVELYGSSACHLALPTSDIDICIASGYDSEAPWFQLSPFLERFGVRDLQVITSASVPVLKFVDANSGLSVDITFGMSMAPSVKLVLQWTSEMERLKPLTLIVKYLLLQRNLHFPYTGGLGSFSVVLMVRHFLLSLQRTSTASSRKGGPKMTPQSPLGPLLLGFLRYFGRFNSQASAVKEDGSTVPKSSTGLLDPKQPYGLVLLNPLMENPVNCAASSFRWPEVAAMFLVVEKQLREALSLDLSLPSAPYPSVVSSICFVDHALVEWRRKMLVPVSKKQKRNPKNGKAPNKMFKVDHSENAKENAQVV